MTLSITKTTAAIFYQKSEVVQEEYRLIELVTLRETEINYLQKTSMPVSESIASRILCLPLYFELSEKEILNICLTINNTVYVK